VQVVQDSNPSVGILQKHLDWLWSSTTTTTTNNNNNTNSKCQANNCGM